mmetsp:Transcript_42234/g.127611  ORF Transcript_42234/g.127611 Transcript_42234/m.127611 type:complete len:218 (-) Transcript_42234:23-676(-)
MHLPHGCPLLVDRRELRPPSVVRNEEERVGQLVANLKKAVPQRRADAGADQGRRPGQDEDARHEKGRGEDERPPPAVLRPQRVRPHRHLRVREGVDEHRQDRAEGHDPEGSLGVVVNVKLVHVTHLHVLQRVPPERRPRPQQLPAQRHAAPVPIRPRGAKALCVLRVAEAEHREVLLHLLHAAVADRTVARGPRVEVLDGLAAGLQRHCLRRLGRES